MPGWSRISKVRVAVVSLLDAKTLPCPLGEAAYIFAEVYTLSSSSHPAVRVKCIGVRED